MLLLVTGSRNFDDKLKMYRILSRYLASETSVTLIHGAAKGADTIAGEIAESFRWEIISCPANWHLYGNAAGPIRNQQMISLKPDLVLAFPGSGPGTFNCMKLARKAGLTMEVF